MNKDNFLTAIVWLIMGGFVMVGYMFYEMFWLSPRGRDKVSECAKLYK